MAYSSQSVDLVNLYRWRYQNTCYFKSQFYFQITLIQVSYAGSSPALSDRQKYSSFYRLYPSEASFNAPRLAIIEYFQWNIVSTIHQTADVFSLAMKSMTDDLLHHNITVLASEQISDDQDPTVSIQYLKVSYKLNYMSNPALFYNYI